MLVWDLNDDENDAYDELLKSIKINETDKPKEKREENYQINFVRFFPKVYFLNRFIRFF